MDRSFMKLYSMQFFYIASHVFGWTLSTLYFIQKGYSFLDLALYFAVSFITSVLVILFVRDFQMGRSMQIGLVMKMAVFILAAWLAVKPILFLVGFIWGAMTVYYWLPLNIRFFKFRTEGRNAHHSGLYFLMWPVLGTILPAIAGVIAASRGMISVLLTGAALLIPALAISLGIKENTKMRFDFKEYTGNTKGVKTILLLQGIWEGVDWIVVPIVTYVLITNEVNYGVFYSYLGIFGVLTFFIMAHISDRLRKRAIFLYPITIAMAAATILSGLSSDLWGWGIYRGVVSFLVSMFSPFAMALVVDVSHNIPDSMMSREYFLNLGRALGAIIVAAVILFTGNIKYALVASGAILLMHPLFLYSKRKWFKDTV